MPCVEYNVRAVELLFFCHRRYKADDELKFSFSFLGAGYSCLFALALDSYRDFGGYDACFRSPVCRGVPQFKRLLLEFCTVLYSLGLYSFFTDITTLQ